METILIYAGIIWLGSGLLATILTLVAIKREEEYVSIKDLGLSILAMVFGVIFLIYTICEAQLFKGFWNKKVF
jgi:hypothetical protein